MNNSYYIVSNKLQPFSYSFHPLLIGVNMTDENFIKLCENIYKYIKHPLVVKDELMFLGDLPLNTSEDKCVDFSICKGKIPFFLWGKTCMDKIDGKLIDRFNDLNNSLFLDDINYDISNPFIINEILQEYFNTGTILYKPVNKKLPKITLNKYNFDNLVINNSYNAEFNFLHNRISTDNEVVVNPIDVFKSSVLRDLPVNNTEFKSEGLVFHVYAVCFNESYLMPHFLKHYKDAQQIFILDNYSTDKTVEIVKNAGREIIQFNTGRTFNDTVHKFIKNNVWKLSRGKADYVIVQDLDEFLYFPDENSLVDGIQKLKSRNVPYLESTGYNICFNDIEYTSITDNIVDYTVKGYRNDKYDKCLIFNPNLIQEINYEEGCHKISPKPSTRSSCDIKTFILHYKHIGRSYEMKRKMFLRDRMSVDNSLRGFGTEYFKTDRDIILEIQGIHEKAQNIFDIIHSKPKITCNIRGGLGNQLFTIAATLAHGWTNNMTPFFRKKMELSHNPIGYWNDVLISLPYNDDLNVSNFNNYEENIDQVYEPIKTEYKDTIITGYFQSIKYFEKYESRIRDIITNILDKMYFMIRELIINTYEFLKNKHNRNKIVGIFVRRGDFINLDAYSGKWLVPLEYYNSGIQRFREDEKYKNCKFIVFSEDLEWCRQHFPEFEVFNNKIDIVQFYILSKVDGWILGNSSFSWWSEFIGNPEHTKKVIAPYPWLKDHKYNENIYRDYWEKIQW